MINLTTDEIIEITGRVKYKAQVKVLCQLVVPVKVRADGKPIVARQAYLIAMGVTESHTSKPRIEPNFEAIRVT